MALAHVSLLEVQRDLYRLPRGMERFREYLRTIIDPDTGDLGLPLVAMNPMGKDHLPAFLDDLIALDADGEGAKAAAEAGRALGASIGDYRTCLVVCDDLMGGWTNRFTTEHDHRFGQRPYYKRGWIAGLLWTSEPAAPGRAREEVLQCIHRAAYIEQRGDARTLGEMMTQEGHAMKTAGCREPALAGDDLAYTREVLAPYRASSDHATVMACLYGDEAAKELGYRPMGLSPRAGLALALAEAIMA